MKIGYIGLGLMGGPLARNLIRAGKEVKVFDLNEESIKRTLAVGTTGVGVKSADELADCDVVFTSLPLPVHIKSTMIGENGLLNKMKEGSVYRLSGSQIGLFAELGGDWITCSENEHQHNYLGGP